MKTPERWAFDLTHILNKYHNSQNRFPVNVEEIAKNYSLQKFPDDPITLVKGKSLSNFDGGLFKAPKGKEGWGIIYNNDMSQGRINFTLAHEFGHYLLHRKNYPEGIQCGEQDIVRWDSEYGQIEFQANAFATNLLMPLDDYRLQINPKDKVSIDVLSRCAEYYDVSLIAVTLRWLQYTERRAVLVVSREGFILWARSSKSALRSKAYFKTSGQPPVAIPAQSVASKISTSESQKQATKLPAGIWFDEPCHEMVVFSELYDFTISLILLENL